MPLFTPFSGIFKATIHSFIHSFIHVVMSLRERAFFYLSVTFKRQIHSETFVYRTVISRDTNHTIVVKHNHAQNSQTQITSSHTMQKHTPKSS